MQNRQKPWSQDSRNGRKVWDRIAGTDGRHGIGWPERTEGMELGEAVNGRHGIGWIIIEGREAQGLWNGR